jgi:pimeloyl-ACP methyl ester carboxylesterase
MRFVSNLFYCLSFSGCCFLLEGGCSGSVAQTADPTFQETPVILETTTGKIYGTLELPAVTGPIPVALIIAGSGPTDRDGNNTAMKNNSLLKLAQNLAGKGIASLRFDKRGIAASRAAMTAEKDLRFDVYVEDAKAWILLLKKDPRFSQVVVIGHSEGSLIGMIAAKGLASKYVSMAGAGRPADQILKMQFSGLPQTSRDLIFPMLDSLKAGKTISNVEPSLYSLFRPSVQPYMISWFKYDPKTEIGKLDIPVLILQGKEDVQVSADDANLLKEGKPGADLVLFEKMNHILRDMRIHNRDSNLATYTKPDLPLAKGFSDTIAAFILKK